MTEHLLTVEADTDYAERHPRAYPELTWSITCINPDSCNGWSECDKDHEVDGVNAADGPYDAEDGRPWAGLDEFEFHGEEHTWRSGHGWTSAYKGCVVQGTDVDLPDELHPLRPGKWIVDDDWDDEFCELIVVRKAEEPTDV